MEYTKKTKGQAVPQVIMVRLLVQLANTVGLRVLRMESVLSACDNILWTIYCTLESDVSSITVDMYLQARAAYGPNKLAISL